MEKPEPQKNNKTPREIESQKFDDTKEFLAWENDREGNLKELRELVRQGVVTVDFEKDKAGNIKSVKITRLVGKKIILYADNQTLEGREDIRKIMEQWRK